MKNINLTAKSIIFGLAFHSLLFLFILFIPNGSVTAIKAIPFGINNPYTQNEQGDLPNKTSDLLKDLDVSWVSDSVFRRQIEIKSLVYDWSLVDNQIQEYKQEAGLEILFVINPNSNYQHKDGRESDGSSYLPAGPQSVAVYEDYVKKLVARYKGKVAAWMVFNEPFGEYKDNIDDYVELVGRTYRIVKDIDSQAEVALGGVGGGQKLNFHKKVFQGLQEKYPEVVHDIWFDYHTYSWDYRDYDIKKVIGEKNSDREPNTECEISFTKTHADVVELLRNAGWSEEEIATRIINKEGATHSGDFKDPNQPYWCYTAQTETQQAEFLFKRAIDQASNKVRMILWSTLREKESHGGDSNSRFTSTGLIYSDTEVKKLSYYTYKFLIEKLKGSDFDNIKIINTGIPNVRLYEFNKEDGPTYVAWWDYFSQGETGETKQATLALPGINASQVKITQAVPSFPYDFQTKKIQLNEKDYPDFFSSSSGPAGNGNTAAITLGKKPVYIETFNSLKIINPQNKAKLTPGSTLKVLVDPGDITNIKDVYFFIDGEKNCQDSGPDKKGYYACNWKTPKKSNKLYKITAKAYNKSEFIAEDSIDVVVD